MRITFSDSQVLKDFFEFLEFGICCFSKFRALGSKELAPNHFQSFDILGIQRSVETIEHDIVKRNVLATTNLNGSASRPLFNRLLNGNDLPEGFINVSRVQAIQSSSCLLQKEYCQGAGYSSVIQTASPMGEGRRSSKSSSP